MIDIICSYPSELVYGGSALIGALIYAGYSIYIKKKEDSKFKIDTSKLIDTIWQSTLTGVAASTAIACGWSGILTAMVCGIGVDKIANKIELKDIQVLNIVNYVSNFISRRKK